MQSILFSPTHNIKFIILLNSLSYQIHYLIKFIVLCIVDEDRAES